VIVDVAIDQGGIFGKSCCILKQDDPKYCKHWGFPYFVSNIPGGGSGTSTIGLTNVKIPYSLQIANKGYREASLQNRALLKGINTLEGYVTNQGVADSLGLAYKDPISILDHES